MATPITEHAKYTKDKLKKDPSNQAELDKVMVEQIEMEEALARQASLFEEIERQKKLRNFEKVRQMMKESNDIIRKYHKTKGIRVKGDPKLHNYDQFDKDVESYSKIFKENENSLIYQSRLEFFFGPYQKGSRSNRSHYRSRSKKNNTSFNTIKTERKRRNDDFTPLRKDGGKSDAKSNVVSKIKGSLQAAKKKNIKLKAENFKNKKNTTFALDEEAEPFNIEVETEPHMKFRDSDHEEEGEDISKKANREKSDDRSIYS